jgi:ketopantoate reductase
MATNGVIIGAGRIGEYLYDSNGQKDTLLSKREDVVPEGSSGPIYVCTRNNDLEKIIETTPTDRREDLVFLQNGMLGPYLEGKGLNDNTQALIYFAISKKGEAPIDGKTRLNPDGLTAVTGKWGDDLAERLTSNGLACRVLERLPWEVAMLEKLIWISAFMAVGAKHGVTVGEVEKDHNAEVRKLIEEMGAACTSVGNKYWRPKL